MAARFSGEGQPFEGLVTAPGSRNRNKYGPKWTGEVQLVESHLEDPLRWKRPRNIFVGSMSDLFHEAIPDSYRDRIWATMLLTPCHVYQIPTKRPRNAVRYLNDPGLYSRVLDAAHAIRNKRPELTQVGISNPTTMPAKWIHLGVSVENQAAADERIPYLRDCPAAVRFLSVEPLLEGIDLRFVTRRTYRFPDGRAGLSGEIGWVIVGCESGPKRRNCPLEFVRSIAMQCCDAKIPVFVKQVEVDSKVEKDITKFPRDLRVRMMPGDVWP
jgi:protein gp37